MSTRFVFIFFSSGSARDLIFRALLERFFLVAGLQKHLHFRILSRWTSCLYLLSKGWLKPWNETVSWPAAASLHKGTDLPVKRSAWEHYTVWELLKYLKSRLLLDRWNGSDFDELGGVPKFELFLNESVQSAVRRKSSTLRVLFAPRTLSVELHWICMKIEICMNYFHVRTFYDGRVFHRDLPIIRMFNLYMSNATHFNNPE